MTIRKPKSLQRSNISAEQSTKNRVDNLCKNFDVFKTLSNTSRRCCANHSIYEIIYNLGTKWLVCNECMEIECFNSDIKERVRIKQ